MSTMKRALSWCLLQLLVLVLNERWLFFQERSACTSARHTLKQRLGSRPIRGDPFITFAERGRGVEKLDQNANAVREVA